MMEMDAKTKAKYEAWKRRKILRLVILAVLFLGVFGGLFFGLRSCSRNGYTENDIHPDESTEEIGPDETEEPTEAYESGLPEIRIQFAGDILIHAAPIEVARTGDNTFDFRPFLRDIKPFIDGDLAIANLEVPVDAHGDNRNPTGWPLFNAPFEILEAAKYAGFNHLITANNHAFDQGWNGLLNTISSLERAGIAHTGISASMEDFNTSTILDVNGIQVGIIAYTDSVNNLEHLVPESSRSYAVRRFRSHNLDSIPAMTEDIANLREAGAELVIVSLHWGTEYEDAPRETQRTIARALGEVGADVIMGHHSHTVHPIEWHYREDGSRALIIYSLGNFLADQTRLTQPSVESQLNDAWNHHQFIGRTQFGMLLNLQVIRELDGRVSLGTVDVLPTLCMRDFSGNTLGTLDGVSVMPLIDGELPDFVVDEELRHWGRVAYEHVVSIVGEEFIARSVQASDSNNNTDNDSLAVTGNGGYNSGDLSDQLNDLVDSVNGMVGISFHNLTTGAQISINGDHLFFGASTAKLFTHLYIADRVANGELSWSQTVSYQQADHFEGGTGLLQNRISEGEEIRVEDLLRYSIRYSDNIAHNMLSSLISPTRQGRRDIVFPRYLSGHRIEGNYLTANHLAQGLNSIDSGRDGSYRQIYGQMRDTIFRDRLNTGPAAGSVAHIIGTNEAFVHDAGIFRRGHTSYILVVMTHGVSNPHTFISDVSSLVWLSID